MRSLTISWTSALRETHREDRTSSDAVEAQNAEGARPSSSQGGSNTGLRAPHSDIGGDQDGDPCFSRGDLDPSCPAESTSRRAATTPGSVTISISVIVSPTTRKANMARGSSAGSPHCSGRAVDERQPGRRRPPRQGLRHGRAAPYLGCQQRRSPVAVRGCRFHRGAVGTEDGVGVEQGHERFEVPVAGGGQESLDYLLLAAPVPGCISSVPWTRRRARLASWRAAAGERSTIGRDVLERHREEVVEHEGEALGRAERLKHKEQRRAHAYRPGPPLLREPNGWLSGSSRS